MLTVQSPVTGNHLIRPKPGRRPLQPLRSQTNIPPPPAHQNNHQCIEIPQDCNKENPNQNQNEKQNLKSDVNQNRSLIPNVAAISLQFEVSLADELTAMREKMERLKADKEKTEKMLRERGLMMEMKMKELDRRGEIQKALEIEVDRLYRLNELKSLCNRIQPIRSLREKEQEKIKPDKSQGKKVEEVEEKKVKESV
ncbi:hypothetical protein R6Q59_027148 [Mikania micrantha]